MRGIILLSIGHPTYALWAHNMIVSIRANSKLPIHLVTNNYPQKDWHTLPDKLTEINTEDLMESGKISPAKAKLSLWKYSEFDETIYLDVDGCLIRELDFQFKGFTTQINGYSSLEDDNTKANLWVRPEQVYEKYSIPKTNKLAGSNSSFMAWDKEGIAVLKKALENLANPIPVNELRYKWGKSNAQPDELYLNIAMAQLGIEPEPLNVLYTKSRSKGGYDGIDKVKELFYVICCWGGLEFNAHEISGTGNLRTGMYNKQMAEYYKKIYGGDLFNDHFYSLINKKIYNYAIS